MSKHVEEILDLFRNNHLNIKCVLDQYSNYKFIQILNMNLYPDEEHFEVFSLENNKFIMVEDLEFARIMTINENNVVFLGNYRFYFKDGVFNI